MGVGNQAERGRRVWEMRKGFPALDAIWGAFWCCAQSGVA
jgi:hypothetical protein